MAYRELATVGGLRYALGMKDVKATVITRYDLDLGDGIVLKDATKTDHEELTRWEGTLFKGAKPLTDHPELHESRNEAFAWTHRKELAFGGFFRDLFADAKVDGLRVVAASDNLPMLLAKEPEPAVTNAVAGSGEHSITCRACGEAAALRDDETAWGNLCRSCQRIVEAAMPDGGGIDDVSGSNRLAGVAAEIQGAIERQEAIAILSGLFDIYGDNDFDPDLHLADSLQRLAKHLRERADDLLLQVQADAAADEDRVDE